MLEPTFDNSEVRVEYQRWIKLVGDNPYESHYTVGLYDVLRAHFLILDYFFNRGEGVGGVGPKSLHSLHSAIYRQFVAYGGLEKWKAPLEKAATLFFGIIRDHPFHDANKRTALLVLLLSLLKCNRIVQVPQKELEDFAVHVAERSLGDRYRRARNLTNTDDDNDVSFIADFIRRNSRQIERAHCSITFNDLNRILGRFGFRLENPNGNHIDIVRPDVENKTGVWLFRKTQRADIRVGQVSFPGWKCQVGRGTIASVRKSCGLTEDYGYDSKAFFEGADPLPALIAEYAGPLERLAYR